MKTKSYIFLFAVEAKKAKQYVSIGYQMIEHQRQHLPEPTVVEYSAKDNKFTRKMKRIIYHMTRFDSTQRMNIQEVDEELTGLAGLHTIQVSF